MALNIGSVNTPAHSEDTFDARRVLGSVVPAAPFAPAALPPMQFDTSLTNPAVLGARMPAPSPGALELGNVSTPAQGFMGEAVPVLGGPAAAPGSLTKAPLNMPRVPGVVMPETDVTGQARRLTMPEMNVTGPTAPGVAPAEPAGALNVVGGEVMPADLRKQLATLEKQRAKMTPQEKLEEFQTGALKRQETALREQLESTSARFGAKLTDQANVLQAEEEGLRAEKDLATKEAAAVAAEYKAAQERLQQRNDAAKKADDSYQLAQKELDGTKIDVDKAYGGAAGRIFAGLAVALGSFGASLTGGPNYAMQIVNDRINRELDAQKTELEKKKGKVTELGRMLERNERLLGDAQAARNLTLAQSYTALRNQAKASTAFAAAGPKGAMVLDDLQARAAESMQGVRNSIFDVQTRRQGLPLEADAARYQARVKANQAAAALAAKRAYDEQQATIKFDRERALQTQKEEADLTRSAMEKGIESGELSAATGTAAQTSAAANPKAVSKALDELAKPAVGVKDLPALMQHLDSFENAIKAYGSASEAPGAGVNVAGGRVGAGVMASTPSLTERARALDQARTAATLSYRHDLTGAAGSASEDEKIATAAGGGDPVRNQAWIDEQRKLVDQRVNLPLSAVPVNQREAVRAAIYARAGSAPPTFAPSKGPK
jgi:hypothetical protein